MNIGPTWTDERIDTLKQLVADGLTAREIGKEMGVTRNAVIGKLGRMQVALKGLPTHPERRAQRENAQTTGLLRKPGRPKQIRQYRGPWPDAPTIVPDVELYEPPPDTSEFACTIVDLGSGMCRWIMGDAGAPYCGAPCVGSWCRGHRRIVFPRSEKRER